LNIPDAPPSATFNLPTDKLFQLINSNGMEVFSKFFRRLLQSNASQVFSSQTRSSDVATAYPLLVEEVKKVRQDIQQAYKIAESCDTTEGEIFRDFDLSTFMEHFRLDPIAKSVLALAFKTTSKPDLRTKGQHFYDRKLCIYPG
jgi:CCR4-NOT transcription complex subunit 1